MDDDFPPPATATPPVRATTSDRKGSERPDIFRWRFAGRPVSEPRNPVDVSSVLGMPLGAIPKPIQEAVAKLIAEIERLRAELDHAHGHESWLEERGDHHPLLPVLHRRAFLRELGRLVEQSARADLPGTLLYLHVGGIERLRVVHGLAAGEAALLHVADHLRAELRQSDLLGYLDGGDFVVALALAEDGGADEKAEAMAARLTGAGFDWEGKHFLFTVTSGLAHFRDDYGAESLLAAADAARRGALGDDVRD